LGHVRWKLLFWTQARVINTGIRLVHRQWNGVLLRSQYIWKEQFNEKCRLYRSVYATDRETFKENISRIKMFPAFDCVINICNKQRWNSVLQLSLLKSFGHCRTKVIHKSTVKSITFSSSVLMWMRLFFNNTRSLYLVFNQWKCACLKSCLPLDKP